MDRISPSVNIIRDETLKIKYFVTPNSKKVCNDIFENFDRGIHSFNLIGSFGTGKSSFLWALEKSLTDKYDFFKTSYNGNAEFIKIVGNYYSLKAALNEEFGISEDYSSNQKLFDSIFQRYKNLKKNNGLLVIVIDEFGKFLEYAAKNNPEDEIYFIQKLAEFINYPERKIILLTSLHQSFESYGYDTNKNQEWKKIKGRFKDLTFNEPVEQLLFLASSYLSNKGKSKNINYTNSKLIGQYHIFNVQNEYIETVEKNLFPLSAISSYTLAQALKKYGQNERSLFTFLNSIKFSELESRNISFELPELYDYLFEEFYNFITSKANPDYSYWSAIKSALERAEVIPNFDIKIVCNILKALGLLLIFSSKGSKLNRDFIKKYFSNIYSNSEIDIAISTLEKNKILRFSKFDSSYKLTDGTDLDIDKAIMDAGNQIDNSIDVLSKLNSHFNFPVITAKSITYRLGTPRLFEFKLSNFPIIEIPNGEIDGYINLIFSEKDLNAENLRRHSEGKPILFGQFLNTSGIFETLYEIEKTNKVLRDVQDENDRVAIRELESIIRSQENLLNHYVMDSLFSNRVVWYANGNIVPIENKKSFNQILSEISATVYNETPLIKNELINRHKVSGSISSARKNYWKALVNNYNKEDLGFKPEKWPAEKTIYYTLLKRTGIHGVVNGKFTFNQPDDENIISLWNISNEFLNQAKSEKKPLLEFIEILHSSPIKIKQGVIDFWIPTFLFIKRGDFALFSEKGLVPNLDESILYMMTRNPKEYYIKSFELNNLRLNLFNKYRNFLKQENRTYLDSNSFIESIKPLLIFYTELTAYGKNTKTISQEAINLREAISQAKDPEETFFEEFPKALGYSLNDLDSDNKLFDEYIIRFQNGIQEIKDSFSELLNRFESFICDELVGRKVNFKEYKSILKERFSSIKEHNALAKHKMFLLRIQSKLDVRESYLMSIGQALIGKPLNHINDKDENLLFQRMQTIIKELDNLVDLNKVETNKNELLIKLELTTKEEGSKEQIIRVPENKLEALNEHLDKISKELDKNVRNKLPILVALLKKELDKNDQT